MEGHRLIVVNYRDDSPVCATPFDPGEGAGERAQAMTRARRDGSATARGRPIGARYTFADTYAKRVG